MNKFMSALNPWATFFFFIAALSLFGFWRWSSFPNSGYDTEIVLLFFSLIVSTIFLFMAWFAQFRKNRLKYVFFTFILVSLVISYARFLDISRVGDCLSSNRAYSGDQGYIEQDCGSRY
jgi:hypothetical protein